MRARIAAACAAAGRSPDEVALLAVTKTVPAADVATLIDLGLDAFAENRAQEAAAKVAEVARLRPRAAPRWYFVGSLQRNKARVVAPWAARVESVDSVRLADALDAAARRAVDEGLRAGPLPVLLQLSADGDPHRGGVPADGLGRARRARVDPARPAPRRAHGRRAAGRRPGARVRRRGRGGRAAARRTPGGHHSLGWNER